MSRISVSLSSEEPLLLKFQLKREIDILEWIGLFLLNIVTICFDSILGWNLAL
jgi:hypothetical protein